jgi:maleylacetoacetate isomerase
MKLYSYYRSSASYRVRIALNLKGLKAEMVPVNLLKAEQKQESYLKINPQQLLPALVEDGNTLTQSLAIIEYMEERYPQAPLLPLAPLERARVRALALAIACEVAPLCNSGPMGVLGQQFGFTEAQKMQWYQHWMEKGFTAVERMLTVSEGTGTFCHGATPTLADCFLVPQVYNARRYNIDLTPYPSIARIDAACAVHPAFMAAHPSKQPDAV